MTNTKVQRLFTGLNGLPALTRIIVDSKHFLFYWNTLMEYPTDVWVFVLLDFQHKQDETSLAEKEADQCEVDSPQGSGKIFTN